MVTKKSSSKSVQPSGRKSLASHFDDADASQATNNLPEGEHVVRINSFSLVEKAGVNGAQVEYECIDGDNEGKKGRGTYKLTDADGNRAPGLDFLKRDLALLGYDEIPGAKLKSTLERISEEQPMVVVRAKENGQYVNVYLQGLAEDTESEAEEEAEEEEEATDEAEVEIGTQVSFTDPDDEDETLTGEVVAIKDETATVLVGKKKYKVEGGDLTIVTDEEEAEEAEEEEAEAVEIEVGSRVQFTNDEDEIVEGKVVLIKGETATVKDDDGDKHKVELESLELVEDSD